ncbi:MAG TPA: hypothetical protein VMW38_10310 [Terriglobia bacterium]|nr:hypothetical protein [Terriglobia bacterium]
MNKRKTSTMRRLPETPLLWVLLPVFAGASLFIGTLFAQETKAPPTPAPATDQPADEGTGKEVTGSIDIGYRWKAGFDGNEDMYRSIVNLGQGPRLLGANLSIADPLGKGKYVDRLQFNANSWGGDPYNTARLFAEKTGVYQFSFDYRNIKYFNNIPVFANPLLGQGIYTSQQAFDSERRTSDFQLTFLPGKTLSPFIAYSRDSGFGPGITTLAGDGNEFPVFNQLRDTSDYYRGGITLNLSRANILFEQGYLTFKDDQRIYQSGGTNTGNRPNPLLGQDIILNELDQNYHVRGTTPVTRVQATAIPWTKLTMTGRFVYSRPSTDFNYDLRSAGNFLSVELFRIYAQEWDSASANSDRPHELGDFQVEFRPHNRIRILEDITVDHFDGTGSSSLARSLAGTQPLIGPPDPNNTYNASSADSTGLKFGLNQNQVEAVVNITPRLSVRGGNRYIWSDSTITLNDEINKVSLTRNIALAGFSYRLPRKASLSLDFEDGTGSRIYTRTDNIDYKKVRVRGRYQFWDSLMVSGSFNLMNNENGQSGINYDFKSHGFTIAASYTPKGNDRFVANLQYSRSDLNSDILYIIPQLLTSAHSLYIADSNYGGGDVDVKVVRNARVSFGGALISTNGNLPLKFYQPHAGFVVPLQRHVALVADWRYYRYKESNLALQNFKTNLITGGFRFTY